MPDDPDEFAAAISALVARVVRARNEAADALRARVGATPETHELLLFSNASDAFALTAWDEGAGKPRTADYVEVVTLVPPEDARILAARWTVPAGRREVLDEVKRLHPYAEVVTPVL